MQTRQYRLAQQADAWGAVPPGDLADAQLVLAFGPSPAGEGGVPDDVWFGALADRWPRAARVYCSTAGHIAGTDLVDGTVVVTVVRFASTEVRAVSAALRPGDDGRSAGAELAAALPREVSGGALRHALVFAEGLRVNGGALVAGVSAALPDGVRVTGGLAGDDERLAASVVALGGPPAGASAIAVGFYGDRLTVGAGALGGWEVFGPARLVTRAEEQPVGSVVYELDGESALGLYKRYLGPLAAELPASGLLFPIELGSRSGHTGVVRTVLGIDEATGAVRFAGNVPEGAYVRLMQASAERLINAAADAAELTGDAGDDCATFALIVSCAGRRWVLRQRTEEELEAVREALGAGACMAGYYSYGEIAPTSEGGCALHNQTMTVTTFREG